MCHPGGEHVRILAAECSKWQAEARPPGLNVKRASSRAAHVTGTTHPTARDRGVLEHHRASTTCASHVPV